MEPYEVATKHTLQDLLLIRTDGKGLRGRPGDMPEERDGGVRTFIFYHLTEQGEMEILYENKRIVRRQLFQDAFGELAVNCLI
jgi:hypothetical protein